MKNREKYLINISEFDLMSSIEENTGVCPIRAVAGISRVEKADDRTTENIRLKKFISSIRSYYRENIAWVDLFEEQAAELITEEG